MIKVKKDHKEKITKALSLCENSFNDFIEYVTEKNKVLGNKLSSLLLRDTFFAGEVFRSTFINKPVNNIDIYFKDPDSITEFKHLLFSNKNIVIDSSNITNDGDFIWDNPKKGLPPIVFKTKEYGQPNIVLDNFAFTLDKHYFKLNVYKMQFDIETFSKSGRISNIFSEKPQNLLKKAFRFSREGIDISSSSLNLLINRVMNYKRENLISLEPIIINTLNSSKTRKSTANFGLSYTERDYVGLADKPNTMGIVDEPTSHVGREALEEMYNTGALISESIPQARIRTSNRLTQGLWQAVTSSSD